MADTVLALNTGSSSLKAGLFAAEADGDPRPVLRAQVEGIGTAPHLKARDASGTTIAERRWTGAEPSFEALLGALLDVLQGHGGAGRLLAAGHRVVHGGPERDSPARVTEALLAELDRLTPLAPLHQPHSLAPIRAVAALRPGLPQVACFDTAFHHDMPPVAARFALPREYEASGVRRYGFHGLSYEFVARRLRVLAPGLARGRVVVAHLGSGASLCAMRDGRSMETTMGFTALDGLVMGTRCGALDPGVVLYLQQARSLTPGEVEDLLYRRSGLLGVSGLSADMRALLASQDPRAREAVELFVYRLAGEAAALASALGGLDGLVFTAGVGENAPAVRAAACARLAWLGTTLDPAANAAGAGRISAPGSRVEVWVVPTDEEATIARHTLAMLSPQTPSQPPP